MTYDDDMARMTRGRPAPRAGAGVDAPYFTGRVAKVADEGTYVTPIYGDLTLVTDDHPVGPCRGGKYRDTASCPNGAHAHPLVAYPVGTIVLVAGTAGGHWIVRAEGY